MVLLRYISLLVLIVLKFPLEASADQIQIGVINYPPYVIIKDNDNVSGSVPQILRAAFAEVGDQVVFEVLPFKRTILLAEDGSIDAAAILNPASSDTLLLSKRSVGMLNQVFIVRKQSGWTYMGIDSLAGQIVATAAGYNYSTMSQDYQNYLDTEETIVSVSSSDNYLSRIAQMMLNKRIDVFNEAEDVMFYHLRTMGIEGEFKTAGVLGEPIYMHTGFKPGPEGQAIKLRFDEGFEKAVASGKVQEILAPYGLAIAD